MKKPAIAYWATGRASGRVRLGPYLSICGRSMKQLMIVLVAMFSLGIASVASGKTYDVKQYGAKGDGKTDDTAAISRVIMEAAGTGATVFFPAGTYLVVNLPVASKITLAGDPEKRAILKLNHQAIQRRGCIIAYSGEKYIDQLVIRDLKFDGSRHDIPEEKLAQLVNIFRLRDSQVINCEFYDGKGGAIFQRGVSNLKLENCTVRDSDSIGFYIQNGNNVTLVNCHSIRNESAYGIFEIDYLTLKGCTGKYSTSGQIQIDASRHVKYIDCVSAYNRGQGFNIMASHFRKGAPPHDVLYENCIAHDNGEVGFNMCGAHNVTLRNCKSYNNGHAGVAMATVDELKTGELMGSVAVTGCEIRDNGMEAILVNGARNCEFSGNVISGNGGAKSGAYNAISINEAGKKSKAKGYLSIGIRVAGNEFTRNRQSAHPFLVGSSSKSEHVTVISDVVSENQVSLKGPDSELMRVSRESVTAKLAEVEKRDRHILDNLPEEKRVVVIEGAHKDWFADRAYPGFEGIELSDMKQKLVMKAWKGEDAQNYKRDRDALRKKFKALPEGIPERDALEKEYNELVSQRGAVYRQRVKEILGEELFKQYLENLAQLEQGTAGRTTARKSARKVTPKEREQPRATTTVTVRKAPERSAQSTISEVKEKLRTTTSVNIGTVKLSIFAEWVRRKAGLKVTVRTADVSLTGERHVKQPMGVIIRKTMEKNGLSCGYSKDDGMVFYKKSTRTATSK